MVSMKALFSIGLMGISFTVYCQTHFQRGTNTYIGGKETRSAAPIAVADLNGDYYDDIVTIHQNRQIAIGYGQGPGNPIWWDNNIFTSGNDEWSVVVGDLDNDGTSEIIVSGLYNGAKILKRNGLGAYQVVQTTTNNFFAQASSLVDINSDGFLDYFVCNDDGANLIFLNNKAGLLEQADIIDFTRTPITDASGNYGAVWVDVNNDGKIDLYIAKCRAGADSPLDPRRINQLYINHGDGVFKEEAAQRGVASGAQSWVGSFADIDHDGDLDLLVANHYEPHELFINDGTGHFDKVDMGGVDFTSFAIQAVWRDFDNDGWVDVLISGIDTDLMIWNRGNGVFESEKLVFGINRVHSFSVGDFNDDGAVDVFAGYGSGFNTTGLAPDEIWLNTASKGNYLKIGLQDKFGNRTPAGTRVLVFQQDHLLTHTLTVGESYGITTSPVLHFGLGNAGIDSLQIIWPDGSFDRYSNIKENQIWIATQGVCIAPRVKIEEDLFYLCPNTSVTLSAPSSMVRDYQWSNGGTTETVTIQAPTVVTVHGTDAAGCPIFSSIYQIRNGAFHENTDLILEQEVLTCFGESIGVQSLPGMNSYNWSNGLSQSLGMLFGGIHYLETADFCGNSFVDSILVREADFLEAPQVDGQTLDYGATLTIPSLDPNFQWYDLAGNPIALNSAASIIIPEMTADTSFFVANRQRLTNRTGSVGIPDPGTEMGNLNNSSGLVFDVMSPTFLKSFDVYALIMGRRTFEIMDSEGNLIWSLTIMLSAGLNTVPINFELPVGQGFVMRTKTADNQFNLGSNGPQLSRISGPGVRYPYTIEGSISIESSLNGPGLYFYFFNWQVDYDFGWCESERTLVNIKVLEDPNQVIDQNFVSSVLIYPNPASDLVQVSSEFNIDKILVFNSLGIPVLGRIRQLSTPIWQIDLGGFPQGLYYIQLQSGAHRIYRKLVLVE